MPAIQGKSMKIMALKAGPPADFEFAFEVGHEADDSLNFISECTGQNNKEAKVATAKTLWAPAVKNRWAFREIRGSWDAQNEIRALLSDPR